MAGEQFQNPMNMVSDPTPPGIPRGIPCRIPHFRVVLMSHLWEGVRCDAKTYLTSTLRYNIASSSHAHTHAHTPTPFMIDDCSNWKYAIFGDFYQSVTESITCEKISSGINLLVVVEFAVSPWIWLSTWLTRQSSSSTRLFVGRRLPIWHVMM